MVRNDIQIRIPMNRLKQRKLYVPALSIIGAVVILLILTAVSTYRTLKWQRAHNLAFLEEKALTIVKVLEAGARAGVRMPMWDDDLVRALLEETSRVKSVAYLYLCDLQGRIVHHSLSPMEGNLSNWQPEISSDRPVATRIRSQSDGSQVLDVAKIFMAALPASLDDTGKWDRFRSSHGHIIVLGMKMTAYEAARRSDLRHALIMGGIVVALGSGALFFLLVVQNVYSLDRSLAKSRDLNRQIIASMADGLIGVDSEGDVVVANPLARRLLGMEDHIIEKVKVGELLDFKNTGIAETLAKGTAVIHREIRYQRDNGAPIPLSISATPIYGKNQELEGAVILIRDLREIKRLEAEVLRSENLAAIGKLAAGVAHEIRNPLSSIRGFAGYIASCCSDQSKEKECAEIMISEVDRINQVVSNLLSLSHPRLPDLVPTSVRKMLSHAATLIATDAEIRGVKVICQVSPGVDEIVVDSNQMTQVLLNLLINALRSVADHAGVIQMGSTLDPEENGVHIWVEDNGIGIAPIDQERIFEPFFSGNEDGTGLGLAIVRNIVTAHGGTIRVLSPCPDSAAGAKFIIEMPRIIQE